MISEFRFAFKCFRELLTGNEAKLLAEKRKKESERRQQEFLKAKQDQERIQRERQEEARRQAERERQEEARRQAERQAKEQEEARRKAEEEAQSRKRAEDERQEQSRRRRQANPPKDEKHYASVLEITGPITKDIIKNQYRDLASKYHPDKVRHLGTKLQKLAEEEMKLINEAYDFLSIRYGR